MLKRNSPQNELQLPDSIILPKDIEFSVGRQVGNSLVISSTFISRKHAVIEKIAPGQYSLMDYGSTNGTLVDGEPIPQKTKILLHQGAVIVFGGDKPEIKNNCSYIFYSVDPKQDQEPSSPKNKQVEEIQKVPTSDTPESKAVTPHHYDSVGLSPTIRKKNSNNSDKKEVEDVPESISAIFGMSTDSVKRKSKSKTGDFNEFANKIAKTVGTSESKITRKSMKARTSGRTKLSLSKSNVLNFTDDVIEDIPPEEDNSGIKVSRLRHGYVDEEFCKTASARDLDKAIAAGISVQRVVGIPTRSAFSLSVEANNLQFAMRVLSILNGEADLSRSNLTIVPPSIIRMAKANLITKLDISNNKLNTIPLDILEIPKVIVSGNPLEDIPKNYRDSNWPILKKNIQSTITEFASWDIRKIIVVGGEGTGKTSVSKCIERDAKIDVSKRMENELIEINSVKIEKMDFTILNLGGFITSKSVVRFFMSFSGIYLVTFNATNIDYSKLEYWIKRIKQSMSTGNRTSFVILVGTHCETLSEEETNEVIQEIKTRFPKHVFPMIQDIIPVSCKTGASINKLRRCIRQLASHSAFIPDKLPGSWIQLYLKCRDKWPSLPVYYNVNSLYLPDGLMSWNDFSKWQEAFGIFEKSEQLASSRFLSDYTLLSHFDRSMISNFVLLGGTPLLYIITSLYSCPASEIPGIVSIDSNLFRGIDAKTYDFIVSLLIKYNIIFYLSNWNKYFVPSLLGNNRPTSDITKIFPVKLPEDCVCYGRLFQFHSQPLELFERIQCSMLNFLDIKVIAMWSNGIVVQYHNFVYASLEYFFDSYKLMLEVRYNKTEMSSEKIVLHYWRQLIEMLRTQINSWCGIISREELVPCIHCMRQGVFRDRVYLFPYQKILDETSAFVYCHDIQSSSRCIDKTEVAPDISLMDLPQVNERKLKIGKQIGQGGFGKVFKGKLDGQLVAVKELSHELSGEIFKDFQSECFVQCLLDHENVVKLYGVTASPPRMILQFIDGGDLYHLIHPSNRKLSQSDFPWSDRLKIAFDIARGVYHMQSQNPPIIHRDLRSPNIFMTSSGRAMIGDFGLAKLVNPEVAGMLGTWQWLAPECITSNDLDGYDHRTDIYSLGIVFWEIASLDLPFDEYVDNPAYASNGLFRLQEVKRAIIEENLRPTVPSCVPKVFKELIEKCWVTQINERPSAREVLEILAPEVDQLNVYKEEIARRPIDQMYLRLGSHLGLIVPTTKTDRPLCVYPLAANIGKPRKIAQIDECVYIGTSKGYLCALTIESGPSQTGAPTVKQFRSDWKAHNGRVASVIWVQPQSVWSCSDDDGMIRIWNHTNNKSNLEHYWKPFSDCTKGMGPSALLYDPLNQRVWCGCSQKGSITIWNQLNRSLVHTITDESLIGLSGMEIHKNYMWIANEGKIMMYDINSFEFIGNFQAHDTGRMPTYILSVGENVWTASSSEIRIWAAASIESLHLITSKFVGDAKYEVLHYSKDDDHVFSGAFNGELIMWNASNATPKQEIVSSVDPVKGFAVIDHKLFAISNTTDVCIYNSKFLHSKMRNTVLRQSSLSPKSARNMPSSSPSSANNNNNNNNNNGSNQNSQAIKSISGSRINHIANMASHVRTGNLSLHVPKKSTKISFVNPSLRTLRQNALAEFEPEDEITISLIMEDGSIICTLNVNSDYTISQLIQKQIPETLKIYNKFESSSAFTVCWFKREDTAVHFTKEDLDLKIASFVMICPKLQIKFLGKGPEVLSTIDTEKITVYATFVAPNSATIQIHSI